MLVGQQRGQCTTTAAAYQIGDSSSYGLLQQHGAPKKSGGQEQWSCIRLSDLGQEHNCIEEPVWHLAPQEFALFTSPPDENTQAGNFFLKYISLERKGVCSNKYVSLHKYEAISAPRCGVYWSSGLFWCNILGPRPAIWGLCREALLPYLLDMNNIAGAKILRL